MTTEHALYVSWLARSLAEQPPQIRHTPHYDHMGALLADATLQAGLNYYKVVRPRVERMIEHFQDAQTTSGLARLATDPGLSELLRWRHPEKLMRFEAILTLCVQAQIESTEELSVWLADPQTLLLLADVRGVGPKTIDYLRWLCGHDVVPVDRYIVRFMRIAGAEPRRYLDASDVLAAAAGLLGWSNRQLEYVMWRSMRFGI